jgi:CRP/FNR family transcriptional regulator, cyclic AMP receptor protein
MATANALQQSTIISIEKKAMVIAKISQETLAEMIGTTRSGVSFFLNRFRELGFIDYNASGMNVNSSLVSVVLDD